MKKFSWILALLAALTMVFVGVGCGGGDDGPAGPVEDLVIDDADDIGALLTAIGFYDAISEETPQVVATKNKATFDMSAGTDNFGFEFAFPEGVEKGHKYLDVTFKVVSIDTLQGIGNAKIGFKANVGDDLTPYDDFEIIFGTKAELDTTKEFIQTFPLAKLTKQKFVFSHNKYGPNNNDPSNPKKGSEPPVKYTLEITEVKFYSGAGDPKIDNFAITTNIAPAVGGTPATTVDAVQFTGAVTWTPAVVDKFLAEAYTAKIVLTAKTGYTLNGLTDEAVFTVTGATTVTYDAATKTVTAVFPAAEAPFDLDALIALAGGIQLYAGGTNAPVLDSTGKVATVSNPSSSMFYIKWADITGFEGEYGDADDADFVKISYVCVLEEGPEAKVTLKAGADSWADLDAPSYPSFTAGKDGGTLQVAKKRIEDGIKDDDVVVGGADGITFQNNSAAGTIFHVKIISVEIVAAE